MNDSTTISWSVQAANGNLWVKHNKHPQIYGFVVFRSIIFLVSSLEHSLWIIDLQTVHFMPLFFDFIFWQIEQCDTKWVRLELFETRLGLFDSKKLSNWVLVRSQMGYISFLQLQQNQSSLLSSWESIQYSNDERPAHFWWIHLSRPEQNKHVCYTVSNSSLNKIGRWMMCSPWYFWHFRQFLESLRLFVHLLQFTETVSDISM